jgi:UDP-2,3-diacylglucosamine pyrophosphatase LpxH
MRLVIISDTHFGDPKSQLAHYSNAENVVLGSKYEQFRDAACTDYVTDNGNHNDYLILLGDIFDMSVASYRETYEVGKKFFRQVLDDKIADHIVYVPGNHDADMWHFYEHEINVTRKISKGKPPKDFRFSVPAIIDGRKEPTGNVFTLHGATRDPLDSDWGYGGTFLDKLTVTEKPGGQTGEPISVAIAYPNVYLVTDNESVMMTHGQYLDAYWSILSEVLPKVAEPEFATAGARPLRDFVALNFPLGQLACSGIGQAGPLTEKLIRPTQADVKAGRLGNVKRYLEELDDVIDEMIDEGWLAEAFSDLVLNLGKKQLLKALRKSKSARDVPDFVHQSGVGSRFKSFFGSSLREFDDVCADVYGGAIKDLRTMIFGHTHDPIKWTDLYSEGKPPPLHTSGGKMINYSNTGGWLNRDQDGHEKFCGAAVISFDSVTQKFDTVLVE